MTEPVNKNFLSPVGFRFLINKIPHVNFFVTAVNLPGLTVASVKSPSPFVKIPLPGDHAEFNNLELTFMVDEDMRNYMEIYDWLVGTGFPKDYNQYKKISEENGIYSDAKLILLTSAMNPNIEFTFESAFPVSISDLQFKTQESDIVYSEATVTFEYLKYTMARLPK